MVQDILIQKLPLEVVIQNKYPKILKVLSMQVFIKPTKESISYSDK